MYAAFSRLCQPSTKTNSVVLRIHVAKTINLKSNSLIQSILVLTHDYWLRISYLD